MNNYKISKILVPVDLSESSFNALDTAAMLAKKHNAVLFLLSVKEILATKSEASSSSMDILMALAGAVRHADDIEPIVLHGEGCVVECIVSTALEKGCDLIVMGTHGASGYRDGFVGSNTYGTIKFSPCPVLSIPPKRKYSHFKEILYPIRPVAGALMRYDTVSKFLADNASMEVMGLSYKPADEDTGLLAKIVNEINPQLKTDNIKVKTVWGNGTALADVVLTYAQQSLPDLIVVTSVLDVVSKSNYVGPHAQKIINCSKAPVLSTKKVGVAVLA